jgi:hypothetical protein
MVVPGLQRRNPGYKEDGLSNAQCEQLNHPDSDHQYRERDGIVIEPIFPAFTHDMPPLYALSLVGAGRQMVQIGRTIFPGGYSALNPRPSFRPSEPGFGNHSGSCIDAGRGLLRLGSRKSGAAGLAWPGRRR